MDEDAKSKLRLEYRRMIHGLAKIARQRSISDELFTPFELGSGQIFREPDVDRSGRNVTDGISASAIDDVLCPLA